MANKILKTLTVDGTSMDIHDLPLGVVAFGGGRYNLNANVLTTIGEFTLTEKGLYLFTATATFEGTTSTGNRRTYLELYNGSSRNYSIRQIEISEGLTFVDVIDTVPVNSKCQVFSDVACAVRAYFQVVRLPEVE